MFRFFFAIFNVPTAFVLVGLTTASAQEVISIDDAAPQPTVTAEQSTFSLNLVGAMTDLKRVLTYKQAALDSMEQRMVANGASEAQMRAWEAHHEADFQAQMDRSKLLGAYQQFQPQELVTEINVPTDASSKQEDLLVSRAQIFNVSAEIHNELFQAEVTSITQDQAASLAKEENEIFHQEHGAEFQAMKEKSRLVAQEQAHRLWEYPDPLSLPAGTTSLRAAFLTLQDNLLRGEIQVHNLYCAGDLQIMAAKIKAWHDKHEDLYQQLNQLSVQLAQSNPVPIDEN